MDMNDFFAMGFCKAAEEHGVDPVQLAKYAATNDVSAVSGPKYKTNGWAPKGITSNGVPHFDSILHEFVDDWGSTVRRIAGEADPENSAEPVGDPTYDMKKRLGLIKERTPLVKTWLAAHHDAAKQAIEPVKDLVGKIDDGANINPDIIEELKKRYQAAMFANTNDTRKVRLPSPRPQAIISNDGIRQALRLDPIF